MINSVNINNFTNWFINELIRIGTWGINQLDNIELVTGVTLLDFTIAIAIISIFVTLILTLPNNVNRLESRAERKRERAERSKK